MNKTLYVKDEDGPLWDRARKLAGDKLSPVIVEALKHFIFQKDAEEAETKGFAKIVVRFRDSDDNYIPKAKAFIGRWLISPDEPLTFKYRPYEDYDRPDHQCFAVAVSAKGRAVFYWWITNSESDSQFGEQFAIYDSLYVAATDPIVGVAARKGIELQGVPVEELDI